MNSIFVGRKKEIETLTSVYNRSKADFVAVYGRRRVGKTYLIRHVFQNKNVLYFEATGLKDANLQQQLRQFVAAVSSCFYQQIPLKTPADWMEAFQILTSALESLPAKKKKVVFLDELPWFASPKSGFIQALDHFWNTKWSTDPHFKLIVCGSAASWMLDNLVRAKGGLHNRLTTLLPVRPFTLRETEDFLWQKSIKLTRKQIVELYMCIGGIPHYLDQVPRGFSLPQIINRLCFQRDGFLFREFDVLLSSLFDKADDHEVILRALAKNNQGLSRDELIQRTHVSSTKKSRTKMSTTELSSGGTFKKRLDELEAAGFIMGFTPYGRLNKGTFFKVSDEYAMFYLQWIEPVAKHMRLSLSSGSYWESKMASQSWRSWAGYAFESVCMKHIEPIKHALGIRAVASEIGSWRYVPQKGSQEKGCQIDLLIDRADGIINMCEMKFQKGLFTIDKRYAEDLNHKMTMYRTMSKTRKAVFLTMVTADGLHSNAYSQALVDQEITIKDLFIE